MHYSNDDRLIQLKDRGIRKLPSQKRVIAPKHSLFEAKKKPIGDSRLDSYNTFIGNASDRIELKQYLRQHYKIREDFSCPF